MLMVKDISICMETKFKFKSQICTSKSQSETLLKLGLKAETADMSYQYLNQWDGWFIRPIEEDEKITHMEIPAWSLHRLIEIMPSKVEFPLSGMPKDFYFEIHNGLVRYYNGYVCCVLEGGGYYKGFIDCIDWLIKDGYFNKEYLV